MLDVGCGIGGSAFYVARKYGVLVNGIDLSQNMIDIANERRETMSAGVKHRCQFHVEDATCMKYPADFYDIVYSRDTILHIEDKESLFRKFLHCLKPGGRRCGYSDILLQMSYPLAGGILLITDYCRGDQEQSKQFKDYVKQRGYHLLTVKVTCTFFSIVYRPDGAKYRPVTDSLALIWKFQFKSQSIYKRHPNALALHCANCQPQSMSNSTSVRDLFHHILGHRAAVSGVKSMVLPVKPGNISKTHSYNFDALILRHVYSLPCLQIDP